MTDLTQDELDRINAFWRSQHEKVAAKTELTAVGEQYVVPGCEKHFRPQGAQLKLWEDQ